jgi:hypothetical protein
LRIELYLKLFSANKKGHLSYSSASCPTSASLFFFGFSLTSTFIDKLPPSEPTATTCGPQSRWCPRWPHAVPPLLAPSNLFLCPVAKNLSNSNLNCGTPLSPSVLICHPTQRQHTIPAPPPFLLHTAPTPEFDSPTLMNPTRSNDPRRVVRRSCHRVSVIKMILSTFFIFKLLLMLTLFFYI